MRSNRRKDTGLELRVRSELHRRGLRYRVDYRPVAGLRRSVDVAFVKARVLVMLDGCFWHQCPDHFVLPKTNQQWWLDKFSHNRQRDTETNRLFAEAGWEVLRFWEHEATSEIADAIETTVRSARGGRSC